jgi:D-sedoheptulose 7-phosphate isomerase
MNLPARDYARMISALVESASVTTRDGRQLNIDDGSMLALDMLLALDKAPQGKAMVIGNGGSAAIASHMVNDLSKAANLRAMAFNDFSLMTAQANDHGYARAYEAAVQQWAQPGDALIAISSSGQSENIRRAVSAALNLDARVITFTGFRCDNPLAKLGELNFHIPAESYGLVELAHSVIAHHLTDAVCHARKPIAQPAIVTHPVATQPLHDKVLRTAPALAKTLPSQEIHHDLPFQASRADHRRSGLRRSRASA